jgi:hypothetical protein
MWTPTIFMILGNATSASQFFAEMEAWDSGKTRTQQAEQRVQIGEDRNVICASDKII